MTRDPRRSTTWRRRVVVLFGAVVGEIVGAVAAVNILILSGVESGYEASLEDVFEHRPVVGLAVVLVLVVSPAVGVVVAWRHARLRGP